MSIVRRLQVRLESGLRNVDVSLSTPMEREGYWTCHYEVGWPEGPSGGDIGGADGPQALYLAMQAVALALYASPHHKAGRLSWQHAVAGYGFPMPKAGRSDLVGQDRAEQV